MNSWVIVSAVCFAMMLGAIFLMFKRGALRTEQLRVDWDSKAKPPSHDPSKLLGHLKFVGPDRYCPTCGRLLVEVNDDGTFNLAPNAGLTGEGSIDMNIAGMVPGDLVLETLVVDAVCLNCNPE